MYKFKKYAIYLIQSPINVYLMFITYLPGKVGEFLRFMFWKGRLRYIGKNVRIEVGAFFQKPQFISLDDGCWIDRNVVILAGPPRVGRITHNKEVHDFPLETGEVYIGKFTHIAQNCVLSGIGGLYIGSYSGVAANSSIYSYSHHYRNLEDQEDIHQYVYCPGVRDDQQSMILGPVYLSDYTAVGLNSVILPGTSLKKGCISLIL